MVGDLNLLIKPGNYAAAETLASEFAGDLRGSRSEEALALIAGQLGVARK